MKALQNDTVADIKRQLAAFGAAFDGEVLTGTRALYRPLLDLAPSGDEHLDQVYGPHERHRLDVYRPSGRSRATVMYVHGGGFVAGDKNGDGSFYRNIGCWLARQGFTAVLPNYRLAPDHSWPAGTLDLQAVVRWTMQDREANGDAAPLVLWGQSAGACHVASWLFDDDARNGSPAADVDGVLLMSGFYRADAPLPAGPKAYFGDDVAQYTQRSPLTHVRRLNTPVLLALAELDPGWIAEQTYALAHSLTRVNGKSPLFVFNRGHNHVSTVQSLGSPQNDVGDEVLRFLASITNR
ncbi:acetyl esterase/lipase [Acidovorax sp. 100]|uniref:alpha/beta hydrolase n=1 Tax=Acidovorax sp. 100 TaxID=2135635 RepID=UPI000EF97D3D|nr:alpha/beta hydrolase [Acidovorax sp. 100]RMA59957.1 acetyl esterase/lipase [Acidovorax sp. 100]